MQKAFFLTCCEMLFWAGCRPKTLEDRNKLEIVQSRGSISASQCLRAENWPLSGRCSGSATHPPALPLQERAMLGTPSQCGCLLQV